MVRSGWLRSNRCLTLKYDLDFAFSAARNARNQTIALRISSRIAAAGLDLGAILHQFSKLT